MVVQQVYKQHLFPSPVHHCHIPSTFLPHPFYDCNCVITIGCSVAAFQWDRRPISCLKHTSMHKHNLLGFLFQKNKSYLTWKAWTFFFPSCLITSSHPAEVNLVQMGVTILQNHYPRVMRSAVPNGWIGIWWAVLTWITARIHIPAHPYFRLSRTPASASIRWWVGWLKFQAPRSSRFSSVGRSSAAATLRLYFEWRLQWKHASTLPSYPRFNIFILLPATLQPQLLGVYWPKAESDFKFTFPAHKYWNQRNRDAEDPIWGLFLP